MSVVTAIAGHPWVAGLLRVVGLAVLAAGMTATAAFVYRTRVRTRFPDGATLILGLGVVAIYLNTRLIFIQFVGETGDPLTVDEALVNVAVFVVAGGASYGGRYVGDRLGTSDRISWRGLRPDFSPIVRAAGRFITVTIPAEIGDIEGYDPVADETKKALAGRTLDFPRGLTVTELQSELAARLREDHEVGYVDVDLAADGTVEFLAVGRRAAGIGPTLPPKSAAVAIRADPPFSATPGDTLQVWHGGETDAERLGAAELRASVGAVATVAMDEATAGRIDPSVDYRLMTLSADSHPDREFAAMLRRSDETMSIVEIDTASPLVGTAIGGLDVTIIAVRSPEGDVETIPKRDRAIREGDELFAVGRPDTLRKLESSNATRLVASGDELLAGASSPFTEDPGENSLSDRRE